ncbi:MAG: Ig-like domain-containing protein [Bacteroidota bacterium]
MQILFLSCANPVQPTGGPKDTIPPVLLSTSPPDQSLNFQNDRIELVFDEPIQAANLQSELIITPRLEREDFNFRVRKNKLILNLKKPLDRQTTYSFNFTETIEDITEKNKAQNIKLSFSTGDYIDSVTISGNIIDHIIQLPQEKITVGLYYADDTLDAFNEKPIYFTRTSSDGNFQLNNLKDTTYLIFAFNDLNSDLQINSKSEPYAFYSRPLQRPDAKLDSISLSLIINDISKPILQRASQSGSYFVARYNKPLKKIDLQPDTTLVYNLIEENTSIRFFQTFERDSVQTIIEAYDSIGNTTIDTIYVKFRETKTKPENFEEINVNSNSYTTKNFEQNFFINKPLKTLIRDSILFTIDSLIQFKPDSVSMDNSYLGPNIQIIHKFQPEEILSEINDRIDSLNNVGNDTIPDIPSLTKAPDIKLTIPTGSLVSIEDDTLASIGKTYKFYQPQDVGTIFGSIQTEKENFTLQLLSGADVVSEINNEKKYRFENLKPGEYSIRILIDENGDGIWSKGNYRTNTQPEPIYNYSLSIPVKKNWEIENNVITF